MDKTLKIALLLTAVDKMSSMVDKAVSKASKRLKAFNEFGTSAGIIGGAITGVYGASVSAARESELANKRLEQVFRSMGETNDKAAKSAEAYASKLEMQIGVEDEVIQLTQAKLATFKAVSSEAGRMSGVFDRATQAAFDMASAGFGEADQNAVQLGKALQDPIQGINALRRSGITFTAAEKKKIATLVKSNKLLDAQKIILSAVEHQVGGVAAATADPVDKMKVGWTEIGESLGKVVLPAFQKFSAWVGSFTPKIISFIENNGRLVKVIGAVGAALLVIGTISKIVSAILATNPIFLIIMAIAALAIVVITYWKPIKGFFIRLWNGIKNVWSKVLAFFSKLWNGVKHVFAVAWAAIKFYFLNFTPIGLLIKYWNPIVNFFTNIWQKVKGVFTAAWSWLMNLGKMFYNAGANIVKNIWEGIKALVNKPIELIKDMAKKIRDFLPFSPAKAGALKDIHKIKLVETIAATIKPQPAIAAMQKTTSAIANAGNKKQQLQPAAINNSGSNYSFSFTINHTGDAANDKSLTKNIQKAVVEAMKKEQHRVTRVSYANA